MFEGACVVSPENILDEISTESSDECYLSCVGTEGCFGFTWFDKSSIFPNFCFMYNECSSANPTPGTVSGSPNCIHQCFNYMELNSEKRNEHVNNGMFCDSINKENHLPDWQGTGYYRFVEPAGVMLSTKTPGPYYCRTYGSMYLDDADNVLPNILVGDEVDAFVCQDASAEAPGICDRTFPITITKCPGDFFVYYLSDFDPYYCHTGFCGTLEE